MSKTIKALRILPPFAIGRLGSADEPMDNYTIDVAMASDQVQPLGYRPLKPLPTVIVGERSGEIEGVLTPSLPLEFKRNGRIRPVAPFLEVFAATEDDELVALTTDLLKANDFSVNDVSWTVHVANRKVARRTGDSKDVVATKPVVISDHDIHTLHGTSDNFVPREASIDFGQVRFIRPNADHPEIRLRFTPGRGLIYGPGPRQTPEHDAVQGLYRIPEEQAVYGGDGTWIGYFDASDADGVPDEKSGWKDKRDRIWKDNGWPLEFDNETLPPSLFAIEPPAPSWLYDNEAFSRGYLDDACDGFVEVRLTRRGEDPDKSSLTAKARICSGPPAMAPDSLFVRSLADDLDQVVFGPEVAPDEDPEMARARAQDIVRRAYETVRSMNVAVLNGNDYKGRLALSLDSMPEEEAADTERAIRPVMRPGTVDTRTITALHQQVYAALRGGAAPWFVRLLRHPNEVADFTDHGRRKMPAMMCGADNNYLALTWRQIHTIEAVAKGPPLKPAPPPPPPGLTPRNLSAQLHYEAKGNPISSRPVTSVANCCPGLEVDFRAVWRRLFRGIELREYDNLVVRIDKDCDDPETLIKVANLAGHRLLRVNVAGPDGRPAVLTMTRIKGPASSDPDGKIDLTTQLNPSGLAPLEWSNALAYVLSHAHEHVRCDFTAKPSWDQQQELSEKERDEKGEVVQEANYISVELLVRPFFEDDTAVISEALAKAGELTQGLCSPWQNDYRECSCYYWASARPDFVNVEVGSDGLSRGDNWFQRERTKSYVPDDYADMRLVMYDELFKDWEKVLKVQIGGKDAPETGTG